MSTQSCFHADLQFSLLNMIKKFNNFDKGEKMQVITVKTAGNAFVFGTRPFITVSRQIFPVLFRAFRSLTRQFRYKQSVYNRLTRLPTNCGRCSLSIFTHLKISITCSLLTRSRWIANVKYVPVLCAPLLWKRKQDINKNNHGYCVTYSNRPDRIAKLAEHWASLPGFPPWPRILFSLPSDSTNITVQTISQLRRLVVIVVLVQCGTYLQ